HWLAPYSWPRRRSCFSSPDASTQHSRVLIAPPPNRALPAKFESQITPILLLSTRSIVMALIGRALAPFAIFLALAAAAPAQDYNGMSTEQLKIILPGAHPSAYYILASKLYDAGEADEAV